MSDVILSDHELEKQFEAGLAKQRKLTADDRALARDEFDRAMAERENLRHDVQKNYDAHKGRR